MAAASEVVEAGVKEGSCGRVAVAEAAAVL